MVVRPQPREIIQPDRRIITPRRHIEPNRAVIPGVMRPSILRRVAAPGYMNLYEILQGLGLTANLKVCIDVADADCYSGSGQNINDLSGTGTHFFRGTTSGSEGSDPTFNGSAGGNSADEYFSYDGGDQTYCQLSVQSWMSAMHQNNAVYSLLAVFFIPTGFDGLSTPCNLITTGNVGIQFRVSNTGGKFPVNSLQIRVGDGTMGNELSQFLDGIPVANAWNCYGLGFTESSGNITYARHTPGGFGYTDYAAGFTYPSPSASAASNAVRLMETAPANCRLAMAAIWQGTHINAAQFASITSAIDAMRGGYGFA